VPKTVGFASAVLGPLLLCALVWDAFVLGGPATEAAPTVAFAPAHVRHLVPVPASAAPAARHRRVRETAYLRLLRHEGLRATVVRRHRPGVPKPRSTDERDGEWLTPLAACVRR
jgi:hypothetical protein